LYFTDNLLVEHDDVFMRIVFQTLEGDVWKWLRDIPIASIDRYHDIESAFMKQWGGKRERAYII
jgi:hypothetical protein